MDKIYTCLKQTPKLEVDLKDVTANTAGAEYDMFAVTSGRTNYQLSLKTFSG